MRLSTRLVRNATTNYLRLGVTFVLGLFTTWYVLGAVGVVGFGLIALASSSAGLSHSLERSLRLGLVPRLAAAIASGDQNGIRCSLASSFRLCCRAAAPLAGLVLGISGLALSGFFNTPAEEGDLHVALAVLVLGEGVHVVVRLLTAPWVQALFAAQRIGLDNLLIVVERAANAVSAVAAFGWIAPDAPLTVQLYVFAATRVTLQLVDVGLGVWLARRAVPGLRLDSSAYDESEYHAIRSTVWHAAQSALFLTVNSFILAILINLFFGLTFNGIWQIVVQYSAYVRIPSEGLLRGIAPLAAHLDAGGRRGAVVELAARSVRYQHAVTLPTAALLAVFVRPLLGLWVGGRLAADPHLASFGMGVGPALDLASTMALILIVVHVLRGGFYGLERVLYGMGHVQSYAWVSKWGVFLCVGVGAAAMWSTGDPVAAPVAALVSQAVYTVAVLSAARRELGLDILGLLRRSLPGPVLVSLGYLVLLVPARQLADTLTVARLAILLIASGLAYVPLVLLFGLDREERRRLLQLVRGRLGLGSDDVDLT